MPPRDRISITALSVHLANGLGPSAFALTPPPPCPALITLSINLRPGSVRATSEGDSMSGLGVNYSAVSKAIYALVSNPSKTWTKAWELMRDIAAIPLGLDDVESVDVRVELPRALLPALAAIYQAKHDRNGEIEEARKVIISDLKVACVIGLHPHEREEKQRLELDVSVQGCDWEKWSHKAFADEVYEYVSTSSYGTIESLNHELGQHLCQSAYLSPTPNPPQLEITIRKPSAIPFATPGITIYRNSLDYSPSSEAGPSATSSKDKKVFIAVGSNIGDRVGHISRAIKLLGEGGCVFVRSSRLYESEPMYVEDQDRFVNGVIELQTSLPPLDLLRLLKRTEKAVGRTKTFTNGPRVIDLDLVFYGEEVVRIGSKADEEDADGVRWLEIPHASLKEREFVLRPLADIAPAYKHPILYKTIAELLDALPKSDPPALQPIIPFTHPARPIRLSTPATPHIMAIFNATPDSFSDGDPARTDATHAVEACQRLVDSPYPPAILDIGGMSTRPNSTPCTKEEELARVVPLIKAIRASSDPRLATIPISVDTYRPDVARAAVEAGASCINDVRGGREDGMLQTMAELDVPVVLMHSRGDSTSMTTTELQDYTLFGGVVEGVKAELGETIEKALKAGVKKWNIILDPGLGFAKSHEDNLRLLKHLRILVSSGSKLEGYPMLVGGSRKGFVGRVIGREVASERGWGDAALNAWCVGSGVVDVLRVHEAREAGEVVKMGLAIRDIRD
ncbi:dihydropteroate synthase [Kwoniella shandongensis]|uniref:Dihydropteroate synthase n=1 Tax=Kwoniella shandongensis TaxID=1734106 RepID=A0A5M6C009_9TREE|nr:dihydropteroate synthase [Kwoniella shandongensis]KAA5528353.1 dihydropteroate synthase [Kwoniella shandongensis]